jgi:hypothetical protein
MEVMDHLRPAIRTDFVHMQRVLVLYVVNLFIASSLSALTLVLGDIAAKQ